MHIHLPEHYPEALCEVATAAYEQLRQKPGFSHQDANEVALAISEAVRQALGGSRVYFPKGQHMQLSARNAEIYRRWTGRNMSQLMKEYGLTETQIRTILSRCQAIEQATRQTKMF